MILFLCGVFGVAAGCCSVILLAKAAESSKMKKQIAEYEKNCH